MNIYWAYVPHIHSELLTFDPILNSLAKIPQASEEPFMKHCPAMRDFYAHTFDLKSPVDFKISGDRVEMHPQLASTHYKMNINDVIEPKGNNVFYATPNIVVYAEKPCRVAVLPPLVPATDYARNLAFVSGEMDCHRWFRSVHAAFVNIHNADVIVERGDTLATIYFQTDEPVKLKRFEWTDELTRLYDQVNTVKHSHTKLGRSLSNYYELFVSKMYHKKILNEIRGRDS